MQPPPPPGYRHMDVFESPSLECDSWYQDDSGERRVVKFSLELHDGNSLSFGATFQVIG